MDLDHDTARRILQELGPFLPDRASSSACSPTPSGHRTGSGSTGPSTASSTGTTSHGSKRTRSRQRPRDDRPRVERHQGAGHAGPARRPDVPDRDAHLGDRLVVPRAGLAAGNDLHEGSSRRRPEDDGRGAGRRRPARAVRLDEPHRDRNLRRDPRRRGPDADRAQHRAAAVRRQLRGLPRTGRQGRRELPRPDGRRLAVGRRPRADRADDARRHQHRAIRKAGSDRCLPSDATRCSTATRCGTWRPMSIR